MDPWSVLAQIVLLLAAATLLGVAAQRLGQNAVIGYLLSGILLGRYVTGFGAGRAVIETSAEIGVALLLFTIGLEFSLHQLRALGPRVAWLGALQILGTAAAVAVAARPTGLSWWGAVLLGLAVAMSSTTVALRLLADRSEVDSRHGRAVIGVALLQDLAVLPSMLIIPMAVGKAEGLDVLATALVKAVVFLTVLYGLMRWVAPAVIVRAAGRQNRDLPVLVSAVVCLGSSWATHALGLSAVLGAFAAGMILASSPLAEQIRADVIPLRAAFLPLFFSSIGMLAGAPPWQGLMLLIVLAAVLMAVKVAVVVLAGVSLRFPLGVAIRAGLLLAQIGEFSFVLLGAAHRAGLLPDAVYHRMLGVSVITLLVSPGLAQLSPALAESAEALLARLRRKPRRVAEAEPSRLRGHVIVVGFGPAGRQVVEQLRAQGERVVVIDSNPKTAVSGTGDPLIEYGDASREEILEHAGVGQARIVVVTVPDPDASRRIIAQVKRLHKSIPIIVRARYHIHQDLLRQAGADHLISEEVVVGRELAAAALAALDRQI